MEGDFARGQLDYMSRAAKRDLPVGAYWQASYPSDGMDQG